MEIFLVRHGKPAGDEHTPITGRSFGARARSYDSASLDSTVVPSEEVAACASNAGCVITSTMNRSRASAERLAPGRAYLSDPVFNEATLPRFNVGLPLRPKLWDFIARVAWFCGWSPDAESLSQARQRARRGARLLAELAQAHGSVMLVGHGIMNALIRHELRRAGWKTSGLRSAYWSLMVARHSP